MTLNELIEKLESIRSIHGGDLSVLLSSDLYSLEVFGDENGDWPIEELLVAGSFVSGRKLLLVPKQYWD